DRRRALGRDHLGVPRLPAGQARGAQRRGASAMTSGVAALALPLAKVGEVGEGFFHERSSETLPCQASSSHLFCFDWAKENIDSFATPALQQFELVLYSVLAGFVVAIALALLAHRRRWLQAPLLAITGVIYTVPSLAFFFLLLPVTGLGRDTVIVALSA